VAHIHFILLDALSLPDAVAVGQMPDDLAMFGFGR
jgi:hypothetical protein